MSTDEEVAEARRKIIKYGAVLGVVLGLVCRELPPEYRHVCNTVTQITSITCGGTP